MGDLGLGKRKETGHSNSPYKHNSLFAYLFAQLIAQSHVWYVGKITLVSLN